MNLDVMIDAAVRGQETLVQLSAQLAAIKAEADATGGGMDDMSARTKAAVDAQNLLGKSSVDVGSAMRDSRARVDEMKSALDAHGLSSKGADDAFKELTISMSKKQVFSDMAAALRDAGQWSRDLAPGLKAAANSMVDAEQAASDATSGPLGSLPQVFGSIGTAASSVSAYIIPVLIGAVVEMGVAMAPVIVAMGSWLIVTGAMTVALAGFLSVLAIGAGAVGILGAAIIALGVAQQGGLDPQQNLTNAQTAYTNAVNAHQSALRSLQSAEASVTAGHQATTSQLNSITNAQQQVNKTSNDLTTAQNNLNAAQKNADSPMAHLIDGFNQVKDTLATGAVPLVNEMASAAQGLLGPIQTLGQNLETWFGGELPGILKGSGQAMQTVDWAIQQLSKDFQPLFDWISGHSSTVQYFFNLFSVLGVQSVNGLITNLLRLSDWFLTQWPKLAPIAGQGFSMIGQAIQGIGPIVTTIVNWISDHWPLISKLAKESADAFGAMTIAAGFILKALDLLGPSFKFLADHQAETRDLFIAMLVPIAVVVAAFVLVVTTIVQVIETVVQFIVWGEQLYSFLRDQLAAGLKEAGRQASDFASTVDQAVSWMGQRFSDLGTAANQMKDTIGGAFSALGGLIHEGLKSARDMIADFIDKADHIPIIGDALIKADFIPARVPGFASGGIVPGGWGGGDSVLARLTPGEVVLSNSAVAGLGGPDIAQMLNTKGATGLGAGLADFVGTIGGQCLEWVSHVLGGFAAGVPAAIDLAGSVTTHTETPGFVGVSTIAPYGHAWIDLGGGQVIDSNWVAPLTVGVHSLSQIPSVAGWIDPGTSISTSGLAGLSGLFDFAGAIQQAINAAVSGLGGWPGGVLKGILGASKDAIAKSFDNGGPWPSGTLGVNLSGQTEHVTTGNQADTTNALLASIDARLAQMLGQQPVGAASMQRRYP